MWRGEERGFCVEGRDQHCIASVPVAHRPSNQPSSTPAQPFTQIEVVEMISVLPSRGPRSSRGIPLSYQGQLALIKHVEPSQFENQAGSARAFALWCCSTSLENLICPVVVENCEAIRSEVAKKTNLGSRLSGVSVGCNGEEAGVGRGGTQCG
jgi:hypothetical protein